MAIEHDVIPIGELHEVANWRYANAATRIAATGFIATDVGKFAWQLDNNTFWVLTAITPTWAQIGLNLGAITAAGLTQATNKLLGRGTAATGAVEEIILGTNLSLTGTTLNAAGGGSGSVTSVSVASANGLAGSVANPTTTPAITLSTSITGILKGNGTAISAASAGTDYISPTTQTAIVQLACSDETTALTTGTAKATFRMPKAMTVTAVRASLTTAQGAGSIFTVDINEGGVSIISTKLTIDNTEKTSTTAATPPVISDANLADDAEITVDIDQVGDGTAKGLKVTLIGTWA